MNVGSVFSGVGLLDYGLHLAGLEHSWFVEANPFRRGILAQRWPGVPVHDDIRTVGADALRRVDVLAGGFPCKGMSSAGPRTGFGHPETALWREMLRLVRELRPRYVLVENVSDLLGMHDGECFGEVIGSLAALRYDTEWDCFPAAAFGAPHRRDRVFVTAVAVTDGGSLGAALSGGRDAVHDGRLRPAGESVGRGDSAAADAELGVHAPAGRGDAVSARAGEGEGPERKRVRVDAPSGDLLAADAPGERRPRIRTPFTVGGLRQSRDTTKTALPDPAVIGAAGQGSDHRDRDRPGRDASVSGEEALPDADERELRAGRHGQRADDDQARPWPAADSECGRHTGSVAAGVGDRREAASAAQRHVEGRGVDVEWGGYEPAIRQWEELVGRPAPEPLIRRVDDGSTAGVERSRLSALGDGVLVQAGWLCGRRIIEAERVRAAL